MKKRHILYALLLALAVIVTGFFVYDTFIDKDDSNNQSALQSTEDPTAKSAELQPDALDDQAIKDKFNCSRMTDDERDSDVFCNFPEIYRSGTLSMETVRSHYFCDDAQKAYPICDNSESLEEFRQSMILRAQPYL